MTCNLSEEFTLVWLFPGGETLRRSIEARYSLKTWRFWTRAVGDGQLRYELESVPKGSLRLDYFASIYGVSCPDLRPFSNYLCPDL